LIKSKTIGIIFLASIVIIGIGVSLFLVLNDGNEIQESSLSDESKQNNTQSNTESQVIVTKIFSTQDEYELNLENSKNANLMPNKPINKGVSSGHVFGFIVDNNLQGGMSVVKLSYPYEKSSVRFTSQFSGELAKVHLYLEGHENFKAKIGLQEDLLGFPSGQWLGQSPGYSETIVNLERSENDIIQLPENIFLKENEIYHIVIEPAVDSFDEDFYMLTYQTNWNIYPFNYMDPDTTLEDNSINTMFFDGASWQVHDKWPIYVIEYADGRTEGQPYSLMAPWVILEKSMVGQTVRPFSNYDISEIAFVVSLEGNPSDNLYYAVYDENNNILRNGTFATPDDLFTKKVWHQVSLESPLSLNSGELYRFILSSPGTDLDNPYKIYGHEFMLDRSLGYGSVNHHLTKSSDGLRWSKWYDADTAFKLITK